MALVFHEERAASCHPKLLAFLAWWKHHGPFDVTVCKDGGLRTDEAVQARFAKAKTSKAKTLEQTPHGRGCALDMARLAHGIVDWNDERSFLIIGKCAESFGLEWGGHWGDCDHLQLPDWRQQPFPPKPFTPEVA
jgi:hypothetical protein